MIIDPGLLAEVVKLLKDTSEESIDLYIQVGTKAFSGILIVTQDQSF